MSIFRTFDEVEKFLRTFERARRRRPILIIIGGTNKGKSELAADVLEKVAKILKLPGYTEVTVEEDDTLDFTSFDLRKHAGILLDGVDNTLTIKKYRETLQGRPKVCRGGRSARTRRLGERMCGRPIRRREETR